MIGKQNNENIEKKIQKRALRILHDDYESEYSELLDKSGAIPMQQYRLNCIILEVLKSLYNASPLYIQDMFEIKNSSYSCEIPLYLHNRNETHQHLYFDHLPISEVSCGMTSP